MKPNKEEVLERIYEEVRLVLDGKQQIRQCPYLDQLTKLDETRDALRWYRRGLDALSARDPVNDVGEALDQVREDNRHEWYELMTDIFATERKLKYHQRNLGVDDTIPPIVNNESPKGNNKKKGVKHEEPKA